MRRWGCWLGLAVVALALGCVLAANVKAQDFHLYRDAAGVLRAVPIIREPTGGSLRAGGPSRRSCLPEERLDPEALRDLDATADRLWRELRDRLQRGEDLIPADEPRLAPAKTAEVCK
jgi:hypothetical protein